VTPPKLTQASRNPFQRQLLLSGLPGGGSGVGAGAGDGIGEGPERDLRADNPPCPKTPRLRLRRDHQQQDDQGRRRGSRHGVGSPTFPAEAVPRMAGSRGAAAWGDGPGAPRSDADGEILRSIPRPALPPVAAEIIRKQKAEEAYLTPLPAPLGESDAIQRTWEALEPYQRARASEGRNGAE
jgi:hypothetical protein